MSNYYSYSFPKPQIVRSNHPFQIFLTREKSDGPSQDPKYSLAINYHSRLYSALSLKNQYLSYKRINIQGLDFKKQAPGSFPGKNFYAVLEITVSNLKPDSAKIVWIEGDTAEDELAPVVFSSGNDLKQTKARIILGVLVNDNEAIPGLPPGEANTVKTDYIVQFVQTDLMMCNMVFDGVPIIYPVPFGGGRLNF